MAWGRRLLNGFALGISFVMVGFMLPAGSTPWTPAAPPPPPPPPPLVAGPGLYDPVTAEWHLRTPGGAIPTFMFGEAGEIPFYGDWDCDGIETPGLLRPSDGRASLRNSSTAGGADVVYEIGAPGDIPLAGDWDGDGCDTVSLYRPSDGNVSIHNVLGSGSPDLVFALGSGGDRPFAGDFDGDGIDEIGLHRPGTGDVLLFLTLAGGPPDEEYCCWEADDLLVSGDWDGDGDDTVGWFAPYDVAFFLFFGDPIGFPDSEVAFGRANWLPVAGLFGATAPAGSEPEATDDGPYAVNEGSALTVNGVLDNDTDPDGDPLTALEIDGPLHGMLTLNPDGSFTYVHDGSETTADDFFYRADDGTWLSNIARAEITVTPINDPPAAVADGPFSVVEGGTLAVNGVLDNDTDAEGDPLTAIKVTDPTKGTLSLAADGSFTYVHDHSDTTSDSFSYKANDGKADSLAAEVTITVTPVPDTVGLVDPAQGRWHLRDDAGQVTSFFFGNPGDVPVMGDWDCDGIDTAGLFRTSDAFAYLSNANRSQIADIRFFFGDPSDLPLAGDWDGDGCDTLSIYRPSEQRFYIINELGEDEGGLGAADSFFTFGDPGDKPVVGDWDADGIDEVGLHRESTGFFYWRNTLDSGIASGEIFFGDPGDRFVAGDWGTVDGADTPAVFRPSDTTFYIRHTLTQGTADASFPFGETPWLPVAGEFGPG